MTKDQALVALKIAHIDTGKDFRGGQDLLLSLARGLKSRGHEQLIVCPPASPLAKRASAEGLETAPLPLGPLRREIGRRKFDILHAHDSRAQSLSFLASVGLDVVRVASRQVAFTPRHPKAHRLKYARTCHGVIAVSEAVLKVLVGAGVPASQIEVIAPGVELPAQLPSPEMRAKARVRWGFGESEFVIGHAGAFTPEKGQDVALDAAAILARTLPRARMVLAGDGPMLSAPEMVEKIRRASLIAQLPGRIDDFGEFYAGLDLYIMPSRSEAWGLTALRAMAQGIPVVASDVGGLPEMVGHERSGWLVPAGSAQALAEAIENAASDTGRLREFGRNARDRAALFTIERTVEKMEDFYQRMLKLEKR